MRTIVCLLALAAFGSALAPACSDTSEGTTSPPQPDAGGSTCPELHGCEGDAAACPSIFPECSGGQCCRPNFGCWECNCDAQCPANRPWCTEGLCGECAS